MPDSTYEPKITNEPFKNTGGYVNPSLLPNSYTEINKRISAEKITKTEKIYV